MSNIPYSGSNFAATPYKSSDVRKKNFKNKYIRAQEKAAKNHFAQPLQQLEQCKALIQEHLTNNAPKNGLLSQKIMAIAVLIKLMLISKMQEILCLSFLKSSDIMVRICCILLAIGSVCLPFIAYNFKSTSFNALVQYENIFAASIGSTANEIISLSSNKQRFSMIENVDPNAQKETDLSKAIMSNGKGLPKAPLPKTSAYLEKQQNSTLEQNTIKFKVKEIRHGMALIEYDKGYWFAVPKTQLPDGSLYLKSQKNTKTGKLELHTTQGIITVEN